MMLIKRCLTRGKIRVMIAMCVFILSCASYNSVSLTREQSPDSYEQGLALLKQFKYGEAKASFDKAIASNPKHKQAFYYRGTARIQLDQLDSAKIDFDKSLKIDPEYALGYVGRAQVYIKKKDFTKAMEQLTKAQALEPKNAEAFYQKGVVFGYQQKVPEAIDSFKRCLEVQPLHAYAHYQIGLAYYQVKRPDLTLVHLEKFLILAPDAPEAEQVRRLLSSLRR